MKKAFLIIFAIIVLISLVGGWGAVWVAVKEILGFIFFIVLLVVAGAALYKLLKLINFIK